MISIRPAAAADFTAISAIDHSAHSHPWPSSVLKRYVEKPHCTWVLEVDGQVLAFAVNTLVADEAELLTIAVSPKQQGLGYGRELMNFLQQSLSTQGAQNWYLDVRESNHKAIALYEAMGFCQAGVRPNYYPSAHGSEDALLYALAF
ncbi:MAG: hypothetical protein RL217_205 [Pseudomonadota bacterium]|jgi:ribosomal-protein-alanine N-acetyltransferase